jgi:hypothetical protein
LPQLSYTQPEASPHVPILTSPPEHLRLSNRVLIIIGNSDQDLGVLSRRYLSGEGDIGSGSVIDLVSKFQAMFTGRGATTKDEVSRSESHDRDASVDEGILAHPGFIVLNPGQNFYSHKYNRAMTLNSWNALPRPTIYHSSPQIIDGENTLTDHYKTGDHIHSVFETVVNNPHFVHPKAQLYMVAAPNSAEGLYKELDHHCKAISGSESMI